MVSTIMIFWHKHLIPCFVKLSSPTAVASIHFTNLLKFFFANIQVMMSTRGTQFNLSYASSCLYIVISIG